MWVAPQACLSHAVRVTVNGPWAPRAVAPAGVTPKACAHVYLCGGHSLWTLCFQRLLFTLPGVPVKGTHVAVAASEQGAQTCRPRAGRGPGRDLGRPRPSSCSQKALRPEPLARTHLLDRTHVKSCFLDEQKVPIPSV